MKKTHPFLLSALLAAATLLPASDSLASCSEHFKWIYTGSRDYTKSLIKGSLNHFNGKRVTNEQLRILKHAKRKAVKRKSVKFAGLKPTASQFVAVIADLDRGNALCNGNRLMTYSDALDVIAEYMLMHSDIESAQRGQTCSNNSRGGCF